MALDLFYTFRYFKSKSAAKVEAQLVICWGDSEMSYLPPEPRISWDSMASVALNAQQDPHLGSRLCPQ